MIDVSDDFGDFEHTLLILTTLIILTHVLHESHVDLFVLGRCWDFDPLLFDAKFLNLYF